MSGDFKDTGLTRYIDEVAEELIKKFVAKDGKLTALEYDRLEDLRGLCKSILRTSEGIDRFEEMKEMVDMWAKEKALS